MFQSALRRQQPTSQRHQWQGGGGGAQQGQGCYRGKPGAAVNTQDTRSGQVIARDSLENGPGDCQGSPHHHADGDARQAKSANHQRVVGIDRLQTQRGPQDVARSDSILPVAGADHHRQQQQEQATGKDQGHTPSQAPGHRETGRAHRQPGRLWLHRILRAR